MYIVKSPVDSVRKLNENIFLLKTYAPKIAAEIEPGQFCNIKVSETNFPLLRRPFSVCDVEGDYLYFMFNVVGEGTRIMSEKKKGEILDILGPLGNKFGMKDEFDTGIIVAGGLGAAPFPYLTKKIKNKKLISFIGGRTKEDVTTYGMDNTLIATDDGSEGFKGTVLDLVRSKEDEFMKGKVKLFGCGPHPMLKALQDYAKEKDLKCELSTECAMACGFGICQGCPVEAAENDEKFLLVCKDGPIFDSNKIIL